MLQREAGAQRGPVIGQGIGRVCVESGRDEHQLRPEALERTAEALEMAGDESAVVVAGTMWLIQRWHRSNCVHHPEELARLMSLARSDHH